MESKKQETNSSQRNLEKLLSLSAEARLESYMVYTGVYYRENPAKFIQ